MLQIKRQEQILQLLRQKEAMRIGQIAKALYTSEATVRRDLAAMESEGLVRRAKRTVLLCDSSKLGKKYLYRLGNLRDFDHVITDSAFPEM